MLGAGDLDMIDVPAVPQRFKNGVGKTQHHDVLGGFLAEVVIDPVGVLFLEGPVDHRVEMLGGRQVGAEGFLDDHARPAVGHGFVEPGLA